MLRKFVSEGWDKKLAQFPCLTSPCGPNKIIKRWFAGSVTAACVRERTYGSETVTLICLLRDGDDIYSYDASYIP
jgi:hypothetical protein